MRTRLSRLHHPLIPLMLAVRQIPQLSAILVTAFAARRELLMRRENRRERRTDPSIRPRTPGWTSIRGPASRLFGSARDFCASNGLWKENKAKAGADRNWTARSPILDGKVRKLESEALDFGRESRDEWVTNCWTVFPLDAAGGLTWRGIGLEAAVQIRSEEPTALF